MRKTGHLPRGLRNRNPLNIRRTNQLWQGLDEVQTDREFFRFRTMAWGYRAAFVVIRTYVLRRGVNTLVGVVKRWAPDADGNDSDLYLARVMVLTGMDRETRIDPYDAEQMVPLVAAMSRVENGRPAVLAEVLAGWALYAG